MKHANMHEYRSLMNNVDLPDRVRDTVMQETRRAENGSTSRRTASRHAPQRPYTMHRFVVAGACTLALAAGIGIVGSIAMKPAPEQSDAPLVSPDNPNGNFFALAAYAAENPEAEPGKTVEVSLGRFSPGSSMGQINLLTGEEYADGRHVYAFIFDVTCTGENIQSITYEIVGNDAYFESYDEEEFLRAHGVYGDDDPAVENGYTINDESTFTVDYESQDLRENLISCHLLVPFTMRTETQTLMEQLVRSEGDEYLASMNAAFAAEAADASQALSQSQLKLTATFADGSTQSKSYVIAPVDGFEETYRAYCDTQRALFEEQGTTEGFEEPKLYTITEIVEG